MSMLLPEPTLPCRYRPRGCVGGTGAGPSSSTTAFSTASRCSRSACLADSCCCVPDLVLAAVVPCWADAARRSATRAWKAACARPRGTTECVVSVAALLLCWHRQCAAHRPPLVLLVEGAHGARVVAQFVVQAGQALEDHPLTLLELEQGALGELQVAVEQWVRACCGGRRGQGPPRPRTTRQDVRSPHGARHAAPPQPHQRVPREALHPALDAGVSKAQSSAWPSASPCMGKLVPKNAGAQQCGVRCDGDAHGCSVATCVE